MSTKYSHLGYKYQPWDDIEEDNRKTFHTVVRPDGTFTFIQTSPYKFISKNYFELWVEAGCPTDKRYSEQDLLDIVFYTATEENLLNEKPSS